MLNSQKTYNYLRGKFVAWNAQSGNLERYVDPRHEDGIAKEFQRDIIEVRGTVCPYIKEAGYAQSRSLIVKAAEGLAGILFWFPLYRTADVILSALMDVCGYIRQGHRLIQRGL